MRRRKTGRSSGGGGWDVAGFLADLLGALIDALLGGW